MLLESFLIKRGHLFVTNILFTIVYEKFVEGIIFFSIQCSITSLYESFGNNALSKN